MHEAHWKAAKMHQLAAQAHRTAAEHNGKRRLQGSGVAFGKSAGVFGSRLQTCPAGP